jgi:xanthine/uracil permease
LTDQIHEVDRKLPAMQAALLGFQHVLVMYSACIIVPLIWGAALNIPKDQLIVIISADLFIAGIASMNPWRRNKHQCAEWQTVRQSTHKLVCITGSG